MVNTLEVLCVFFPSWRSRGGLQLISDREILCQCRTFKVAGGATAPPRVASEKSYHPSKPTFFSVPLGGGMHREPHISVGSWEPLWIFGTRIMLTTSSFRPAGGNRFQKTSKKFPRCWRLDDVFDLFSGAWDHIWNFLILVRKVPSSLEIFSAPQLETILSPMVSSFCWWFRLLAM